MLTAVAIIVGFIFRLAASLNATGVIHPDEIFQGMEMAHLLTYGSGRVPPEFAIENERTPSYAASRSWLFPLILSGFMRIGEFFGLNYHSGILPLLRIIFAINSTLLIPATSKLARQITHNNKNVGVTVAVIVSLYWRIVEYTVRPLSNTFFLPFLFYGIYRVIKSFDKHQLSIYDHFVGIICIGIPTYIRLDLGVIVFSFFIVTFSLRNIRHYIEHILNAMVGWFIGIQVDYHYYNKYFTVPINWFKFNIIEHNSDWFGVQNSNYYYRELIVYDKLEIWIFFLLILLVFRVLTRKSRIYLQTNKDFRDLEQGFIQSCICTTIIWTIFSSFWRNMNLSNLMKLITDQQGWNPQSHKEIRFMIGGLIVLIISISISIVYGSALISEIIAYQISNNQQNKKNINLSFTIEIKFWTKLILSVLLISLLLVQSFYSAQARYHLEQFDDTNQAFIYIGNQDNVTGIIAIAPWFQLGSYTYLHLNMDVVIWAVDFSSNDPSVVERNLRTAKTLIENWEEGNYLILPRYQAYIEPAIWNWLRDNNWQISTVIDGKTEVWKRTIFSPDIK